MRAVASKVFQPIMIKSSKNKVVGAPFEEKVELPVVGKALPNRDIST
jgi:hypothetical protein